MACCFSFARCGSTLIGKRLCLSRGTTIFSCLSTSEALNMPKEDLVSIPQSLSRTENYGICSEPRPGKDPPHDCDTSSLRVSWDSAQMWFRLRMLESAKAGHLTMSLQFLQLLEPNILNYNGLLYSHLQSGHASIESLMKLFEGMKTFGPCPNALTFHLTFNGFCALGHLDNAFIVLNEMCSQRFVPSFNSLRKLMKKSLASGCLELSLEALRLMLKFDYLPTSSDVNNMTISLIRGGRVIQAYEAFAVVLGKGFIPNIFTCNSILFGLCKSGQNSMALSLFYSLRKKGFSPNVYSYTAIVLGLSKEGLWKKAYCVLKQMQDEGCLPTVVTYTILIKSLCTVKRFREAFDIFEMMDKKGCPPDVVTCNVILHALCCNSLFTEANNFIQVMQEKGYLLDRFSYCVVASGLLKAGFVNKSIKLLDEVLFRRNNTVDVVTWNVYFHSLCCNGSVKMVQDMVETMIAEGFAPTTTTCNIILKGLCKENNMDEALVVLDQFGYGGNEPDVVSFNTILSTACKQKNSSVIRRVITKMGTEGVELDIIGMTCLMQYYGKIGMPLECYNLFKYMILYGHIPSTITYNVLLHSLCEKGFLILAYRIFQEFKNIGTFPDTTSYNILIHASIREAGYSIMKCLLTDMYRQGLLPDAITYGSLSYGLCSKDRIRAAAHLENWMLESGIAPKIPYYNTMLGAAFRMGKLWDVFLILVKMEIEGVAPDAISFKFFKRTMVKGGGRHFPNAMKILEILMNN